MTNDINFLYSKRRGTLGALTRKIKLLRFIAIALLLFAGVLSVSVFLLILASPLPRLKNEENALLDSLSRQHEKITKQTLIVNRLDDISQIVTKRPKFRDFIITFTKDIPQDLEITLLEVEQKTLKITIETKDLASIGAYIESLNRIGKEDKRVARIFMNSFGTSKNFYQAEFIVEFL
ncbi:MAG: hypothetical protein KatS3mg089_0643 [Patescibacteria group bacterium]|nr:MAG: hypothetical protein KatS3mg089_0643 [Patescibacteria group bacterium]